MEVEVLVAVVFLVAVHDHQIFAPSFPTPVTWIKQVASKSPLDAASNMLDVHGLDDLCKKNTHPGHPVLQHFPALFPGTHTQSVNGATGSLDDVGWIIMMCLLEKTWKQQTRGERLYQTCVCVIKAAATQRVSKSVYKYGTLAHPWYTQERYSHGHPVAMIVGLGSHAKRGCFWRILQDSTWLNLHKPPTFTFPVQ